MSEIDLPVHPYLNHPLTGCPLQALGVRANGKAIWPILGAEDPDPDPEPKGDPDPEPPEFKAPSSQAEFDRMVQDRVRRAEKKGYDSAAGKYKEKADKHDALEAELGSDKDKAVHAAREEEQKNARSSYGTRLVKQAFKAEAKGVLSDDQLDGLLEDLDLSKYLDNDGEVDEEKITAKVKKIAPANSEDDKNGRGGNGGGRGLGQGNRPPSNAKPGDAGRARAEKRFGTKKSA